MLFPATVPKDTPDLQVLLAQVQASTASARNYSEQAESFYDAIKSDTQARTDYGQVELLTSPMTISGGSPLRNTASGSFSAVSVGKYAYALKGPEGAGVYKVTSYVGTTAQWARVKLTPDTFLASPGAETVRIVKGSAPTSVTWSERMSFGYFGDGVLDNTYQQGFNLLNEDPTVPMFGLQLEPRYDVVGSDFDVWSEFFPFINPIAGPQAGGQVRPYGWVHSHVTGETYCDTNGTYHSFSHQSGVQMVKIGLTTADFNVPARFFSATGPLNVYRTNDDNAQDLTFRSTVGAVTQQDVYHGASLEHAVYHFAGNGGYTFFLGGAQFMQLQKYAGDYYWGVFGHAATQATLHPAPTDLATAIVLLTEVRAMLIANGQARAL